MEVLRKSNHQGKGFFYYLLSLVHSDKKRQNSNLIIIKEPQDTDQLFSKSTRTGVKDVGSKHENVRLKRGGKELFGEVVKTVCEKQL